MLAAAHASPVRATNRRPDVGTAPAQAEQKRAGSYGTPKDDGSHSLGSAIGQRAGKRHEDDQSDDRNNNYHDDHFWVAEALAGDHERSGNVALAGAERHDPSCVGVRTTEQPTNCKAQGDK